MSEISLDAIRAELRRVGVEHLGAVDSDGKSFYELSLEWRMGENTLRRFLKRCALAGVLHCERAVRTGIDGRVRMVPVYSFVLPESARPPRRIKKVTKKGRAPCK